jgi:hypothetical protein
MDDRPSRARRAARIAAVSAAVLSLLSLQGCLFFVIPDAIRGFNEASQQSDVSQQQPEGPDIEIIINASGGDAVKVYYEGSASDRFKIAEGAAAWLGAPGYPATDDIYETDTAVVQLNRRLVTRAGDAWTLQLDTRTLQDTFPDETMDVFGLFVCHPIVEVRVEGSRQPDFFDEDASSYCYHGDGWLVDRDLPVAATFTLLPDAADYLRYAAGLALGIVVLFGLAWFVGDRLRRGPFRRRNAVAVAIGLIAGGFVSFGALGVAVAVGAGLGPADNLALAEDLSAAATAGLVAAPALVALIPGMVFATLLVRRRPWREGATSEELRPWAWPPPPPPGGPGATPPPPPPAWRG